MSNLRLTKDGRTLYFQDGDGVYSVPVSGGGGGGGGGLAALLGGGGATPAPGGGRGGVARRCRC